MINIYKEDDANLLLNLDIQDANMGHADEFKAELTRLFDTHQRKKLILNFAHVQYIDSSFLGALVSVLKYVISFKSDIVLVGLRKDIHNLFALIRLDKVFKIYENFNEALA
ncbi:STAS domain-containing protein [Mucilaginibacter auburnensis]|uniref:Anti-sigma B factor antagonist n=1 Tax=Mucilaginibacter auburnensis TaxID=1457233 RepID=A0A2H9VVW6_9SPHI|nr:STAS domain-containing protein [Mucilaginibacter auburnensis]PJJ84964.1 anti-sigma B factor antagonist [Mucilaginibacter auburnensis]